MSEIAELESRITAALERISAGLAQLAPKPDEDEIQALKTALSEERAVSAQLEERVRAIKEKQETHLRDLEGENAALNERVSQLDTRLQRMKQTGEQLRESNAALREANAAGVGDAHLINKAMLAELEALRALRDTEQAEVASLLSDLKPLIEEDA